MNTNTKTYFILCNSVLCHVALEYFDQLFALQTLPNFLLLMCLKKDFIFSLISFDSCSSNPILGPLGYDFIVNMPGFMINSFFLRFDTALSN